MSDEKPMSLVERCQGYFGSKSGQSPEGFIAELRTLTPQDKQDLCDYFNQVGLPTEWPANFNEVLPQAETLVPAP